MAATEGLSGYQFYLVGRDGGVVRTIEVDCASDVDAVQKANQLRGIDVVEIEVWERTRFVGCLPVPALQRTLYAWQETVRLIATSAALAACGTALIRWSVEAWF